MPLFIEGVTVSVGYGDFLKETAKWNIPVLDRWIIVTTPDDEETREVCRRFSLECLLSNDCWTHGNFNKGRMIERGLRLLSADSWRLHVDADIAMGHRTRHLLETAELNQEFIYGADRAMVKSWDQWQALLKSGYMQGGMHDYHCRIKFPTINGEPLPIGSRWADLTVGYCPIGYLQLLHGKADQWRGIRSRQYPERHNNACRTDVQFAQLWDRPQRALIPELVVIHLESESTKLGANWNGRKTKRFGPPQDRDNIPTPNCQTKPNNSGTNAASSKRLRAIS